MTATAASKDPTTTSSDGNVFADLNLDISDLDIAQALSVLRVGQPSFLPVEEIQSVHGQGMNPVDTDTIHIDILNDVLLDGTFAEEFDGGRDDPNSTFFRIKAVLQWCISCWNLRDAQESLAFRSRYKIEPSSLKKVYDFLEKRRSGTIQVTDFHDIFSLIRRANSQKAMSQNAVFALKDMNTNHFET